MTKEIWPLRSLLFIPAPKLDWVCKAARTSPDAVILDLEDAVLPVHKSAAREAAREGIGLLAEMGIAPFVRINSLDEGGYDDLLAVTDPKLVGIVLPKVRGPADVAELDLALGYAEGKAGAPFRSVAIIATPETTTGLRTTYEIACASRRVKGLVGLVGGAVAGDFARAAGIRPTPEGLEQLYFASQTVIDSRAAGAIYPVSALIGTRLDDLVAVRQLAERAKTLGFTGSLVIYPTHATIVNEVFSPSAEEIAESGELLAAMRRAEAAGDGAVTHRGRMVDIAMLERAKETLRQAQRYGMAVPDAPA
jgi:citrate lyase subunit beta/citryl-CoA lyase